ncbi:hypothetical protein D3C81_376380 [compost metagenome]
MANNNGYVDVSLIGEEVQEIFNVLLECGVAPAGKHNLHATLMYDKRDLEQPLAELDPEKTFKAYVTRLDVLGDGLVFHLTSQDMLDEHRRLLECGYKHSFDGLLPHMSLTYDFNQHEVLKLKHAFANWGGRELTFGQAGFGCKI